MNERKSLVAPYHADEPDVVGVDGYTGFSIGNDINREIILPGKNETFPDGVVGIRADDDFWVVAALPYEEFKDVPLADIVARFWPEFTHVELKPDSDDPWWEKRWQDVESAD